LLNIDIKHRAGIELLEVVLGISGYREELLNLSRRERGQKAVRRNPRASETLKECWNLPAVATIIDLF